MESAQRARSSVFRNGHYSICISVNESAERVKEKKRNKEKRLQKYKKEKFSSQTSAVLSPPSSSASLTLTEELAKKCEMALELSAVHIDFPRLVRKFRIYHWNRDSTPNPRTGHTHRRFQQIPSLPSDALVFDATSFTDSGPEISPEFRSRDRLMLDILLQLSQLLK